MITNQQQELEKKSNFYVPYSLQCLISLGLIGFGTYKLTKQLRVSKCMKQLKRNLYTSRIGVENAASMYGKSNLVYLNGQLRSDSKFPFVDQLFGVTSNKSNCIGLYRKVEVVSYNHVENKHIWGNINYQKETSTDEEIKNFQSKVILNDTVYLNDLVLSNNLVMELGEQCSSVLQIDSKNIENHFKEIKDQYEQLQSFKQNSSTDVSLQNRTKVVEGLYSRHPFKHYTQQNKHIFYKDNYIYISEFENKLTEGDLRISFHELKQIANATVIAINKNGVLDSYVIPDLNFDFKIIDKKGEEIIIKLGLVNFIKQGIIPYEEFIKQCVNKIGKDDKYEQLFYALLIFAMYNYIQALYYDDEMEKITYVHYKYDFPRYHPINNLSAFISAFHLTSIALFASGRVVFSMGFLSFLLVYSVGSLADFVKFDQKNFGSKEIKE